MKKKQKNNAVSILREINNLIYMAGFGIITIMIARNQDLFQSFDTWLIALLVSMGIFLGVSRWN